MCEIKLCLKHFQNLNEPTSSSTFEKETNDLSNSTGVKLFDEDAIDAPTNHNLDLFGEQMEQSSNDFHLFLSQATLDELNSNSQYVSLSSDNDVQEHGELLPQSAVTILEYRTVALDAKNFAKCGGFKLDDIGEVR